MKGVDATRDDLREADLELTHAILKSLKSNRRQRRKKVRKPRKTSFDKAKEVFFDDPMPEVIEPPDLPDAQPEIEPSTDLFISGTHLDLPVFPENSFNHGHGLFETEAPIEFDWEACDDPLFSNEVFLMNEW
jgi:hypothetical protein